MATYLYETIPQTPNDPVRRFEVRQGMMDAPLEKDPESGLPVRRVITGGFGYMGLSPKNSSRINNASSSCCCNGHCQHK